MTDQKTITATVHLPEESVEIIRKRAERVGTSMSEIIRRAILNDKLLHDAVDEGSLILLKDKDNGMRQLVLCG